MIGSSKIQPTNAEIKMKKIARKSIVVLEDIEKGKILGSKIGVKRPGHGIPPTLIDEIKEKKSIKSLKKGDLLERGDFEIEC